MVNHPAVRPFVGAPDAGELDLSPLVDRDEHLFPFGEHGGFALIWTAPRTREVHTFIKPEGRGAWAVQAASEMIEMAGVAGTERLWTQIAPEMRNVRTYAERAGMKPTGETLNTFGHPHDVFEMSATCQ